MESKTGVPMPAGSSIVPFITASATQAAVIVPVIGNPNNYYVFSLEQLNVNTNSDNSCHLAYSVVNMTLNGGLGDVISSGHMMDSALLEKMIAIPGNNCNIWLLACRNTLLI